MENKHHVHPIFKQCFRNPFINSNLRTFYSQDDKQPATLLGIVALTPPTKGHSVGLLLTPGILFLLLIVRVEFAPTELVS